MFLWSEGLPRESQEAPEGSREEPNFKTSKSVFESYTRGVDKLLDFELYSPTQYAEINVIRAYLAVYRYLLYESGQERTLRALSRAGQGLMKFLSGSLRHFSVHPWAWKFLYVAWLPLATMTFLLVPSSGNFFRQVMTGRVPQTPALRREQRSRLLPAMDRRQFFWFSVFDAWGTRKTCRRVY